jgi:hypothetical protein
MRLLLARLADTDRSEDPARLYMQASAIERRLGGVFEVWELRHAVHSAHGHPLGWRRGLIPAGRFADLPAAPMIARGTVALAAAALEGRLLALLEEPTRAPDETLADATHYTRDNVRQALHVTLKALGLRIQRSGTEHYPRHPAGKTQTERAAAANRGRRAAAARERRARVDRAALVKAERERLDADVAAGRVRRLTADDLAKIAHEFDMPEELTRQMNDVVIYVSK